MQQTPGAVDGQSGACRCLLFSVNVLGVDPGIRNVGLCLGTGTNQKTIVCPRKWPFERCLEHIMAEVRTWIDNADVVAVEEVVWRQRRGMLPLAHVAGAVVGAALAAGKIVYLLTPSMKGEVGSVPKGWTEHSADARALARVAYRAESVPSAATASIRRRRLTLSAAGSARSNGSKNGGRPRRQRSNAA